MAVFKRTKEQMNSDKEIIRTMVTEGGSFVSHLGLAALHADPDNLQKIKTAFPEYWSNYDAATTEMKRRIRNHGT